MTPLHQAIASCTLCAAHLPHGVRPVVQFSARCRLVIVGQAPGSKVHASGIPWDDASGKRLCEWTGLTPEQLHDPACVAIVPMGFCYPGKGPSGDLPPRRECAPQWHAQVMDAMPERSLTLLVGHYAQAYYLDGGPTTMTERVRQFRTYLPRHFPLPHPSWRSAVWMKNNPWFSQEVLPELQARIRHILAGTQPPEAFYGTR